MPRPHRASLPATCLAALAAAAVAAPAASAEVVVALDRPSPVREHAGHLLVSRWDGSAYRLSTARAGVLRDLAVPRQAVPFDADVGSDSAGRPVAIFSQCLPDAGCDLHVVGLAEGERPRPVRNANTADADEVAPTLWKGRIAFGRRLSADRTVTYTKLLRAPRSRPSTRLAGLPRTRCGAVDEPSCRPIEDVRLLGLELWGRWVVQSWAHQPDGFPGFRQNEVRLTDVGRTDTRQLAAMSTGLGGQAYLGPSVAGGRVAFFRACQGDPDGCEAAPSGAFRVRISTGEAEHAQANRAWEAWAYDGVSAFHVPSAFDCAGGDPTAPASEPCGVHRDGPPAWRPFDARRLR